MYSTGKYYSRDASNNIIEWSGMVDDSGTIVIYTGRLDNTREIYNHNVVAKGKLTKYEQAVKELKAKVKLKVKNGYTTAIALGISLANLQNGQLPILLDSKLDINKTDANNMLKPMKAKQFKEVTKFNFPYILQLKINGYRCVYDAIQLTEGIGMFAKDEMDTVLLSKEGHRFIVPHIKNSLPVDFFVTNNIRLDGELYVHGEKLSNIKRRIPIEMSSGTVTRNSLPINDLKYYCFDLSIPEISQLQRLKIKDELLRDCTSITLSDYKGVPEIYTLIGKNPNIINMGYTIVNNKDEVYKWLNHAVKAGYEGVILREFDAEYQFGSRKFNMIKAKLFSSSEFKILDIILKNQDSIRTYIAVKLQNDLNDKTFEVNPNGAEWYRQQLLNNKEDYIGKTMTVDFYERTVNKIPFHILNATIRDSWDLDKTDLNIE